MHIKISGKQIDVGEALRSHVEDSLVAAVGKYSDRPVDANVVFSRNGYAFKCDSSVHLATGLTAQAHAVSDEIYAAFDQAAEKIEKQLRRYKRRLKDHRQGPIELTVAHAYVLQSQDDEAETGDVNGKEPVIIAELTTEIRSLTVGEAVMQMELADQSFLIFKNLASGRLNVVYQRDDGNIGWIDPANLPEG